jgi:hypothetical protein
MVLGGDLLRTGSALVQKSVLVWRWWLRPVILVIWEAEIRRIEVQSQPGQTVHETLSWKKIQHKKRLVDWLKS